MKKYAPRVLLAQIIEESYAFYGTLMFFSMFTKLTIGINPHAVEYSPHFISYLFSINLGSAFPFTPRSMKQYFPSDFPTKIWYEFLIFPCVEMSHKRPNAFSRTRPWSLLNL
jgi:hypothetical protein